MFVGIDFGTTNSALAVCGSDPAEQPKLAEFSLFGEKTNSFRSLLYMSFDDPVSSSKPRVFAGPAALEHYVEEFGSGRVLQSLKSFLRSAAFKHTLAMRTKFSLEDLIAEILCGLRAEAERQFGDLGKRAVVGRPVDFVGRGDDELALERLRTAFKTAGFDEISFEFEPIAAALRYEQRLDRDECILVADFGGGTTDFCVALVGPSAKSMKTQERILATDGVGLAGDAFDGRLVESKLATDLGRGGKYRSMGGKVLDIPDWPFAKLASWHELSFLRSQENLQMLLELSSLAEDPSALKRLIYLLEENLGFQFYSSVESSKRALTEVSGTDFKFRSGELELSRKFLREEFVRAIGPDLAKIESSMLEALRKAEKNTGQIDQIFMTGGTAFVPAVRALFEKHFGKEKLASGDELSSVAAGLALKAAQS